MSAKANGPTSVPTVDTIQDESFLRRLSSCFRKKNMGANGRVVPSNAVNIDHFFVISYNTHSIICKLQYN
jgi:hypothetical protein